MCPQWISKIAFCSGTEFNLTVTSAFKCFGIKAPQDYRIYLLAIQDGPKDGMGSRQQSRLEEKKGRMRKENFPTEREKDLVVIAQKEEGKTLTS